MWWLFVSPSRTGDHDNLVVCCSGLRVLDWGCCSETSRRRASMNIKKIRVGRIQSLSVTRRGRASFAYLNTHFAWMGVFCSPADKPCTKTRASCLFYYEVGMHHEFGASFACLNTHFALMGV